MIMLRTRPDFPREFYISTPTPDSAETLREEESAIIDELDRGLASLPYEQRRTLLRRYQERDDLR